MQQLLPITVLAMPTWIKLLIGIVFDKIQSKESPAVSGRSKSGDVATVALLSKGYGNIALVNFIKYEDYLWKRERLMSIG